MTGKNFKNKTKTKHKDQCKRAAKLYLLLFKPTFTLLFIVLYCKIHFRERKNEKITKSNQQTNGHTPFCCI